VQERVPGADAEYAAFWINGLYGQTLFYVLAKQPILERQNSKRYELSYLEDAAYAVARSSVLALGLPAPNRSACAPAGQPLAK
jgi:hypothetical protein